MGDGALNSIMPQSPVSILNKIFGYHRFRGKQEDIIQHLCDGGDALVLMPTGGGKSLCYQIPALIRPGVAIVVSPLIALMQDQVSALLQLGIRAACLHSGLTPAEVREVAAQMRDDSLDLLYVAPERLLTERFLEFLDHTELALFAIDEAHCVSQWGHDFRPEYIKLSVLHQRFPKTPRVALTATADGPTRREIVQRLQLEQAQVYIAGFDRPNIRYLIEEKGRNPRQQLLRFLEAEHRGDAGIVYCMSRKKVENNAEWLCQQGWNALPYHAGLPAETRKLNQERFLREEGLVMVATIAFGMGIDKPNVRFVAHLDLPKSMEAYYQETGRAGRDGLPANAWLAYGLEDVVWLQRLLAQSEADEQHKRVEQHKLNALLGYCEITSCRRQALLAYFDDHQEEPCGNCDTCLSPPQTWDATEAAQKALSCIYRTGQRYGVNHLIDVLLGKKTEKIRSVSHDCLSTYGIGKELSKDSWRGVFRQLVARGLVSVDVEGFGSLLLTENARPVLRGEEKLYFRKQSEVDSGKASRRPIHADQFDGADRLLWEALREKRRDLAQAQNVPPYVIFHDATLMEMVCHAPLTPSELGQITGVGRLKLQRYGQAFIDVIEAHVQEHGASQNAAPPAPAEPATDTVQQSLDLFRAGHDVAAIACQRELKESTIYTHLSKAVATGELSIEQIPGLNEEDVLLIEEQFFALPEDQQQSLGALYHALDGRYDYGLLRCVTAMLWEAAD